jgi:hypothetical protein
MQTHGISRHADWQIFTEFSEKPSLFFDRVQQTRTLCVLLDLSLGLLVPEDEVAVLCRNVDEY